VRQWVKHRRALRASPYVHQLVQVPAMYLRLDLGWNDSISVWSPRSMPKPFRTRLPLPHIRCWGPSLAKERILRSCAVSTSTLCADGYLTCYRCGNNKLPARAELLYSCMLGKFHSRLYVMTRADAHRRTSSPPITTWLMAHMARSPLAATQHWLETMQT
jgi:hypothetical protein